MQLVFEKQIVEKLIARIKETSPVLLYGHIGSGKSCLVRELVGEETFKKYFILYNGPDFKEKMEPWREIKPRRTIKVFYHNSENIGWQNFAEVREELKLGRDLPADSFSEKDYLFIQNRIKEKKFDCDSLLIILDDYNAWRSGKNAHDFAELHKLVQADIKFLLTSQIQSTELPDRFEPEDRFLDEVRQNLMELPSPDDAQKIAQKHWDLLKNDVKISLSNEITNEITKKISDYSGQYPLLISSLINIFADDVKFKGLRPGLTDKKLLQWLEKCEDRIDFKRIVKILWDSLTQDEQKTLDLLTISKKSLPRQEFKSVYSHWQKTDVDKTRRLYDYEYDYEKSLKSLEKKLLIKAENNAHDIPSSSLINYIWNGGARDLAKELGIDFEAKSRPFSARRFLKVWLFCVGFYLIFIIAQPLLAFLNITKLPDWIGQASLAVPLAYLIFFGLRLIKTN